MKILTVVFDLGKGGTQRAAQNFCEGYSRLGHDSRIMAVERGGPRKDELTNVGIKVWIGEYAEVLEEISMWSPDVIHLHSIGLSTQFVASLKAITEHSIFIETNIFAARSTYTEMLDYSYQLSGWCAYNYYARGGAREKCVVVPNPVKSGNFFRATDIECGSFRQKYGISDQSFVFGRVGQHFLDKWSYHLIDVYKDFLTHVGANATLLLVNPPKELIMYANSKGVEDKLIVIDELIGDYELRVCYSVIDVFVHIANQGESFGLVLAESLLCETPVITLNTPWSDNSQAEVIGNGVGGFSVNTMKEFLLRMVMLFHNPELRRQFGLNGRQRILSRYEYQAVAARSIDIISSGIPREKHNSIRELLDSAGMRVGPIVTLLLKLKLNIFGSLPHSSIPHRIISQLMRFVNGYKTGRRHF